MQAAASAAGRAGWLRDWQYAHRGLHGDGVAENSPAAFAGAIVRGLGIECDVQLSADGEAVVFHKSTEICPGRSGLVLSCAKALMVPPVASMSVSAKLLLASLSVKLMVSPLLETVPVPLRATITSMATGSSAGLGETTGSCEAQDASINAKDVATKALRI